MTRPDQKAIYNVTAPHMTAEQAEEAMLSTLMATVTAIQSSRTVESVRLHAASADVVLTALPHLRTQVLASLLQTAYIAGLSAGVESLQAKIGGGQ